jgi:hypothetical protein
MSEYFVVMNREFKNLITVNTLLKYLTSLSTQDELVMIKCFKYQR